MYGGDVVINMDRRNHIYYDSNDQIIASPSNVNRLLAKPFLTPWAAKLAVQYIEENIEPHTPYTEVELGRILRAAAREHTEYMNDRGAIGSRVHGWIEGHVKHQLGLRGPKRPPRTPGPVATGVQAFLDWEIDHKPTYLFTERVVYSRIGNHVGTADFAFTLPGESRPLLGDFKTGKGVYYEHALQLASYSAALTEEEPETYDWPERYIVKLNTDTGNYSIWDEKRIQEKLTNNTVQQDYGQFRRLLDSWYDVQKGPSGYHYK